MILTDNTHNYLSVALPSFPSRVHFVHTTLKTPRKSMATAIRLLLPTLAQDNDSGIFAQFMLLAISKILTMTKPENSAISVERNYWGMAWHCLQRAVWRNGGCGSLESTTKQQVTWLVASAGSPPLRKAATTLSASGGQGVENYF